MADIKLYIACHKPVQLPDHPYLYPVQAGAAIVSQAFPDMLQDNIGENISEKNRTYCELTVQYWAWKNQNAEYYGFFHYRRFLAFQLNKQSICDVYLQADAIVLEQNGYEVQAFQRFIANYDIMLPCAEETEETVYQKYANAAHHYVEDLDLMMALVAQQQPVYKKAMEHYIYGHRQYYYNMYVMKQEWFDLYCEWLFPLLEQFDQQNDWEKYGNNTIAMRVDGYLAERLFGVWYSHQLQMGTIRSVELPWMYFTMGDQKEYRKQWMKNKLFPPGSKRKNRLKSIRKM